MNESVVLCYLDELRDRVPTPKLIYGLPLVLVRVGDEVFALFDECSHSCVPLSEGDVTEDSIECWVHGSTFDLRTGQPSGPPAVDPVEVYPTSIDDSDGRARVVVELP